MENMIFWVWCHFRSTVSSSQKKGELVKNAKVSKVERKRNVGETVAFRQELLQSSASPKTDSAAKSSHDFRKLTCL